MRALRADEGPRRHRAADAKGILSFLASAAPDRAEGPGCRDRLLATGADLVENTAGSSGPVAEVATVDIPGSRHPVSSPIQGDRPSPERLDLLLRIFSGLAGVALIWIATSRYGPGLTTDSSKYLAAAESFSRGAGFMEFDGSALVEHPPLYPLAIGVTHGLAGWDLIRCARVLGALLFGWLVTLFGSLARHHLRESPLLVRFAPLVVLISAVLFRVAVMAWSEILFILEVAGFLLLMESYRERDGRRKLIALAFVAALGSLTRYLGISLVATGALWLLMDHRKRPAAALCRSIAFTLLASWPLGLWAARNHRIAGSWMGPRDPSQFGLAANIQAVRAQILYWFFPGRTAALYWIRWGLIAAGVFLLLAALAQAKRSGQGSEWREFLERMMPVLLFTSIFILILLISATRVAFDAIDGRLLSPVYLPLGLLLLGLLGLASRSIPCTVPAWAAKGLPLLLLGLWLIYPLRAVVLDAASRIGDGAGGFNTVTWQESETIRRLRLHPGSDGRVVYSNVPDALFPLTGIRSRWTPRRHGWNSPRPGPSLSQLEGRWPEAEKARLIWFNSQGPESYLYGLEDLRSIAEISPERSFADGGIYDLSPKRK
jgi:hypothetical protein